MTARGVVLGTGGHVDHGKTALVRALTGVETDRWREERERGLTIDIGFAPLELEDGPEIGIVDVPGHEDFVKNMLAGATGIDALILVVAADEGPMPQTTEHLAIAHLLGVSRGVVALTKTDRVEEEWQELAIETTRETLREHLGHDRWPIVPVSSLTGAGLDALRRELSGVAREAAARSSDDLFRMPVDRAFSIRGTGTVVTGTVWSGVVRVGEAVRAFPAQLEARVRALQVHGETREQVPAGRRCAIALVGVEAAQVRRGAVVAVGREWRDTSRLGVRLRLLPRPERPLEHEQRLRVYLGTREVMARVLLLDGGPLLPGGSGWAVLKLEEPLVARARDRFVLRFYSPVTTVGGGQVAELDPPRLAACAPEAWAAVLEGSPQQTLVAAVELGGAHGVSAAALPLRTGLARDRVKALLEAPPPGLRELEGRWFPEAALAETKRRLATRLERLHRRRPRASAVSLEALRAPSRRPEGRRPAPALIDQALRELEAEGALVVRGPRVAHPDHRPVLSDAEAAAKSELLAAIRSAGAEPPTVAELQRARPGEREALHDLLALLVEEDHIVALSSDMYVATEVAETLAATARRLLEGGEIAPPTRFKDALGVSRKYLIPILEYLDREGVTRRTGEGRVLA